MGKTNYDVPAVRRAIRLLEVLGDSPQPMGVSELARAIGSNKNMTFRLLSTLTAEGWVATEEPGPRYRMTLLPFEVASRPLLSMDIRTAAMEPMRELWAALGESTYLGVRDDDAVLYIEHLDSRQNVRIAGRVGGRYPLHCTAPGKVLLAWATESALVQLAAGGLERFTENTLCDADSLRAESAKVRDCGWGTDNEEYGRGLLCVAAPIRDHSGKVKAALGVSVTTLRYTLAALERDVVPHVLGAAAEASRRMGNDRRTDD